MRFIVHIVLVVLAVWLIRRALRSTGKTDIEKKPPVEGDLVRCANCGVHLPRAEARVSAEKPYCSDEHARLGPGGQ